MEDYCKSLDSEKSNNNEKIFDFEDLVDKNEEIISELFGGMTCKEFENLIFAESNTSTSENDELYCSGRCTRGCINCKCAKAKKFCTYQCSCSNCKNTVESILFLIYTS